MANSQSLYHRKAKGQAVEPLATFYDTKLANRVLGALQKGKPNKEQHYWLEENKAFPEMGDDYSNT